MIGGSWATVMGFYVLDPWLLKIAGMSQELWRVKDYESDLLILRLSSAKTMEWFNQLENVWLGSRAVLNTILYFTTLCLCRVNAKKLGFREQVMYLWATMIWFTSFKKTSWDRQWFGKQTEHGIRDTCYHLSGDKK
eukprot:11998155-Ditylum_brightwellii.AAC.1